MNGKVCLVTGGSSGIGLATCRALLREGAKAVVAADIHPPAGASSHQEDKRLTFAKCDVSNEEDIKAAVNLAVGNFGSLDVAVNCAGILGESFKPVHEADVSVFDKVIAVNLRGVFLSLKYEMDQMRKQKQGGAIVNISSIAGLNSNFGNIAYCASKHGVIGLTKTAASEGAKHRIRVNAVCPGIIDTPMAQAILNPEMEEIAKRAMKAYPMKRFGKPEEVAAAVLFLCGEGASFITGQELAVEGGILNARL